jgi:type IV secretion system protein TrbL
LSCSITDPVGCLSSAAKSVAGDAFSAIAHDFGKAADSTINWLWGQLSDATAVHLGGAGFDLDLGIVAAITGVVAVGLFVIQLATSVLRRDPGGLGRAVRGLFVAFLAGGAAVGVTNLALSAIDSLSAGVVQLAMGTTVDQMGHKLLAGDAILSVGNPAGMFLLAIVAIAASVIVWAALVVRKALIVVSAVFAPLAFAGSLADITTGWVRKWIEVMAALVISKLVLVIIFIVGWGILDNSVGKAGTGATQSITQTATGLLILALAGFAPWMALKLVHFGEDHFHRLHLLAGSTTSGARTAAAAPQKVAAWKATAASFGATGAARATGGASAAAGATTGASSLGSGNGPGQNGSGLSTNGDGPKPPSTPPSSGQGGQRAAPGASQPNPTPPPSANGKPGPEPTRPAQQPQPVGWLNGGPPQ